MTHDQSPASALQWFPRSFTTQTPKRAETAIRFAAPMTWRHLGRSLLASGFKKRTHPIPSKTGGDNRENTIKMLSNHKPCMVGEYASKPLPARRCPCLPTPDSSRYRTSASGESLCHLQIGRRADFFFHLPNLGYERVDCSSLDGNSKRHRLDLAHAFAGATSQFHFHNGVPHRICAPEVHSSSAVRAIWIEGAKFEVATIFRMRWESAQLVGHFGKPIVA